MQLDYEPESLRHKSKRNYIIIGLNALMLFALIHFLPYEPQVNKGLALLAFVAFFIVFLTEFTSNTASAALLVPIFFSISKELGMHPLGLSMIIGLGASCAFMLPVATPPNAIVFGTGDIQQKEMMKAGFILNIFCAVIIGTVAYFFWLG